MLRLILVVVLALVLWGLYHKIFHVVYFNALHGLFREIVICLVISMLIVSGISGKLSSLIHPEEPAPDCLGSFFNMQFIEGSGFETSLMIQESEEREGELTITGYSVPVGINYVQSFKVSIPYPDGNVFSIYDEWHSSTVTITFNPDEHTLDVIQETTDSTVPTPFTGHYVNHDVWQGLLDERQAATEAALKAQEPNRWIESYFTHPFGKYVPVGDDGIEDSLITFHTGFSIYESSSRYFHFIAFKDEEILFEENILYPLGDAEAETFRRTLPEGDMTITACGFSDDGRPMLEISEFPDSDFVGTYIVYTDPPLPEEDAVQEEPADLQQPLEVQDQPSASVSETAPPETTDSKDHADAESAEQTGWSGTYTCNNGGADGVKTITITQNGNAWLQIQLDHTYGNGRTESFSCTAEIGTYSNGPLFASYGGEGVLYFTLKENTVEISQIGIYPDADLEYSGTYSRNGS